MKELFKSSKLANVCYDIRGPILEHARILEEEGHRVLKLNIGNPAPFGFDAPDEILQDVIYNLPQAQGYCDSKGLFSARKAVMQKCQQQSVFSVGIEDVFMGNGVSELIVMALQALLNDGDEVLIPSPDYPLWTAAVSLAGGNAIHYHCEEENGWQPNIEQIRSLVTEKTRAITVINPNNPTGAVYSKETLQAIVKLAEEHNLVVFADEIYDKIIYDDAVHVPLATLVEKTLCISFNGLSKSYRLAGFRSGWMVVSGAKHKAEDYLEGLTILASMRLCANVPGQLAVQTSLGGYQSIEDLVLPTGRLGKQRDAAWEMLNNIPGVSCVKPQGAIYMFPKIDPDYYDIGDDEQFVLDFLKTEKILLVQGTAFNWKDQNHLRIVFLPHLDKLKYAIERLENFLRLYKR